MMKIRKKRLIIEIIYTMVLVVPLFGILRNYDHGLATHDLADTVNLVDTYPDFMCFFKWAIYIAIACSVFPLTRKFYGILLGFCLGGLMFHYQDIMSGLKSFREMSKQNLEDLIIVTPHGEGFIFWCVAAVVGFILVMVAECVQSRWKLKIKYFSEND